MNITPINYQQYNAINTKQNNVNMKGRSIPYCINTAIHDTFVKRVSLENIRRVVNIEPIRALKNIIENDLKQGACDGALIHGIGDKTAVVKELAKDKSLPLYRITPQDYVDKMTGKEYMHEAAHYIGEVFRQCEYKFKNTGERSIVLFEDAEKICPIKENFGSADYERVAAVFSYMKRAKSMGIIPVFSTNSAEKIDSTILKNVKSIQI